MLDLKILRWSSLGPDEQERLLERPVFHNPGLSGSVATILRRVLEGGDRALTELTLEIDRTTPELFEYGPQELAVAIKNADPELIDAIDDAW